MALASSSRGQASGAGHSGCGFSGMVSTVLWAALRRPGSPFAVPGGRAHVLGVSRQALTLSTMFVLSTWVQGSPLFTNDLQTAKCKCQYK